MKKLLCSVTCAAVFLWAGCGEDMPPDRATGDSNETTEEASAPLEENTFGGISFNGLHWKVGPDYDMNWDQARAWVESLDDGNWRMPGTGQLDGLWNAGISRSSWGPFQNSGMLVWSSSASVFCFSTGDVFEIPGNVAVGTRAFAVR